MYGRSRHPRWRIGILVAGAALCCISRASEIEEFQGIFQRNKAFGSVVKIQISLLDSYDADSLIQEDFSFGHGVYISDTGVILTAAHVVYPDANAFEAESAGDYLIRIYEFDSKLGRFGDAGLTVRASELRSKIVKSNKLDLVSCPNAVKSTVYCLTSKPQSVDDFAFISTDYRRQPPPHFVGVSSPWSKVRPLLNKSTALIVVSDFDAKWRPISQIVENPSSELQSPDVFETKDRFDFEQGVSGSPLFAIFSTPQPSISVIGIAVSSPSNNQFRATLVEKFYKNFIRQPFDVKVRKDELLEIDRMLGERTDPWNCQQEPHPKPKPVLSDFHGVLLGDFQGDRLDNVIRCMERLPAWESTAVLFDFEREILPKLVQIAEENASLSKPIVFRQKSYDAPFSCIADSDNEVVCNNRRVAFGFIRPSPVPKIQDQVAEILSGLVDRGIDPIAFFDFVSRRNEESPDVASMSASISQSLSSLDATQFGNGYSYYGSPKLAIASNQLSLVLGDMALRRRPGEAESIKEF